MENTDDEALSWAGDESRMRGSGTWSVPKRAGSASSSSSDGGSSSEKPDSVIEPVEITGPGDGFDTPSKSATQPAKSDWRESVGLLITGVLAGVYLLFTIAWVITVLRNPIEIADPLGQAMFVLGLWLAAIAPALTFVAILSWLRGRKLWMRLLLLFVGALIFIPWPYLTWVG